ncbi:type II secretion system protein J [Candidatus Omnitrophota bacterium]
MKGFFRNKKGFTLLEILFVAALTLMVIGAILSAWMFTSKTWTSESQHTHLRIDMMQAMETIKNDLRLSSLTYMSFYPESGEPYTGISLPVAETDANGFFTLNANGEIEWDNTVIYHVYTGAGDTTLRRTVLYNRDNTLTDEERYTELENVVSTGLGTGSYSTDLDFLGDLDIFEMSSLSPVIDFYDDSSDPVRAGKVVFGWAKLDDGDHTIRFEITGKNDLSSGYDIGVDNIMLEPAGIPREVEYYNSSFAPVGSLTLSGGSANRVYNSMWSNNNYLEFSNSGTGSYMEIDDYYDLLRDSSFENASLDNTTGSDEEFHIELEVLEEDEEGEINWYAYAAAGDPQQEGRDGDLPASVTPPVAIRTVIGGDSIDEEADLIRVNFKSSSTDDLVIDNAYITKRNGTTGPDGLANQSTSGRDVEEYHRHQQLFFRDESTGNIVPGATVTQGSEAWSVWTAFPLRTDSDYLVSVNITDVSSTECTYWEGTGTADRTYYLAGSEYSTMAGDPDWSSESPSTDEDIFIVSNIDIWNAEGSVESQIYDTTMSAPAYSEIKWSEVSPAGTEVLMKARSSSDEYMVGATDWSLIAGSTANPGSLSVGNNRYVQFMAEMTSDPFWEVSSSTKTYEEYIDDQVNNYPVTGFPEQGGTPYITGVYSNWIDDVEIDWPGDERLCTITGYVARKNSYGQAKVVVDGVDLVKILSVHLKVSADIQGRIIEEENYIEVQPRNTGK